MWGEQEAHTCDKPISRWLMDTNVASCVVALGIFELSSTFMVLRTLCRGQHLLTSLFRFGIGNRRAVLRNTKKHGVGFNGFACATLSGGMV